MPKSKTVTLPDGRFDVSVKAMGFNPVAKSSGQTQAVDPFANMYSSNNIIAPPYNPLALAQMCEYSDVLGPLIEAMITNVDGYGWDLDEPKWSEGENTGSGDAGREAQQLRMLFDYCNPDQNLTMLRKELRADYEQFGYGFLEVIRNRASEITEFYNLPAYSIRLTVKDKEWTDFVQRIRNERGEFIEIQRRKRFRRFVQMINGEKKSYFKEFGDPRVISSRDGKVVGDSATPANEVIMFSRGCRYSPYGVPRWIGCLIGIIGSRKAEEVNYLYFDNKAIPPVVVTVSGGSLTDDSVTRLTQIFEKEIKGLDNFHKGLILEAIPHDVGEMEGEKVAAVRIDVKPLTQFMQEDALFGSYRRENSKSLAASFRMAPLYIGRSDDYTRATAREAGRVMEDQVFDPERREFDYIWNRTILADLGIKHWDFKSLGGKTSDDATIVGAIAGVKEAIPVGIIMDAVAEMRNVPKQDLAPELYDTPLGVLLSQYSMPDWDGDDESGELNKTVTNLIRIRKALMGELEGRGLIKLEADS